MGVFTGLMLGANVLINGAKKLYDVCVSKPGRENESDKSRAFTKRINEDNRAYSAIQAAEQRRHNDELLKNQQEFAARQSELAASRTAAENEKQRKFAEEQSRRRQEFESEQQRKRQEFEREQQRNRQEFEKQQLKVRQEFDLVLNKRNADLQREMAWQNHCYRLNEQELNFNNQMDLAIYKNFLDKWPMMMPIEMLRNEHMQYGRAALGVFLFKNRDGINSEIDKFWDVNIYPLVETELNEWVEGTDRNVMGIRNIKFYRDSFRDDNAHHGSLVDIVRYALSGLPTVVLESNVLPRELRLSFTIWGLGDDSAKDYSQYTFRSKKCRVKSEKGWMSEAECDELVDWICACFKMIIGCNFDAFNLAQYNRMPVFPEIAKYELEQGMSGTPLAYEDLKKEFTGFYEGIYDLLLGPKSAFANDCVNNKLVNAYAMRLCYAEALKDFVSGESLNKWLADSVEAWCSLRGEKPAEEWLKGLLAGEYSRYQYFDADDEAYFREVAELMSEGARLHSVCRDTVRLLNTAESAEDLFKEGRRLCKSEGESERKLGLNLYRRAAEMGLANAQMALGNSLFNGDGVEADKEEAVSWYRRAAEQGSPLAQYKLGVCLINGEGVKADNEEAKKWLEMALEQGYEEAGRKLAELNQDVQNRKADEAYAKKDYAEALKWYRKSAEQGNAHGQYHVGMMFAKGEGVEADKDEAKKWLSLAAEQGHKKAKRELDELNDPTILLRAAYADKQVGERVEFGRYPQGANGEVQPITWRVLRRDKDALLVISELGLDAKPYNKDYCSITWSDCTLRGWLNGEFLQKAFSDAEQSLIRTSRLANNAGPETDDRMYLLSIDEAKGLFANDDDRMIKSTAYAIKNGAGTNNAGDAWWWLRSRYGRDSFAADVNADGGFSSDIVNDASAAVRPAFRIAI